MPVLVDPYKITVQPITITGSLDAVAVAGTATSGNATVNVPVGNSGVITFQNYVDVGVVVATRYNPNGAGFTGINDGNDTSAFTDGQTIATETTSVGVGESRTFDLIDKTTGRLIVTVSHTG